MFKSVLSFLYYLSVAVIVILPIVGSYSSTAKTHNKHHFSVVKGLQCHDSHFGNVNHSSHWDLIKNKQLSRPPAVGSVRMIPAFTIVLALLFAGLNLASLRLEHTCYKSTTLFLPKPPIFLLHGTFLI